MIPQIDTDLQNAFELAERQPSRTYRLDLKSGRIFGTVDQLEAMKQAIYKILNTERYQYAIYSWNYGAELAALIGQPATYVMALINRRITEALTQDDRITEVDNFSFVRDKKTIQVSFTVHTIYGRIDAEKEVNI
ncbi:DUF2634 domain-containing protein [Aminipila butyrica]|uniref:DUF2634 domain-containing protein n=1 Tax=Aminipila butyrica TaxID=433296 RepID=A0A858BV42_9FIRM|nr:DUF2634 domain-containing protein [Aminipila butyrica]QIB68644.1 DUF2634 domain-containing protein [Aminipila butyrica]